MSIREYLIIYVSVLVTMLISRILPVVLLKGKQLHPTLVQALNFIPSAAFAALVANDLFKPNLIIAIQPAWDWLAPLIAALAVVVVGAKTKNMAACIIVGVGLLAILMYAPALF